MKRYTAHLVIIAVALLIAGAAIWCWRKVAISLEAERTHQAYMTTLDLLTGLMLDKANEWPKKWEDLTHPPTIHSPILQWPGGLAEFRKRVFIDFDINRAQVAAMNLDNFSAVRPIGPNYGPAEGRIRALLEAARK